MSAHAKRTKRPAKRKPAEPVIEPSVFRVAIADLTDTKCVQEWEPSSVWETPEFSYGVNHLTLISIDEVGGDSLPACQQYVSRYNTFKMLEKDKLEEELKFWALVICGQPDDDNDDDAEDGDDEE